jgi:hypothetical protein
MIKSVFLTAFALTAFSFSGLSWVKIEKKDRGLFGYRDVYASYSGPNSMLGCANPGWKACKWSNGIAGSVVLNASGDTKTIDDYQPIEDAVMEHITRESTSGAIYFGSDLYVKYTYDTDDDHLVMEVYSLYEARTLGLI